MPLSHSFLRERVRPGDRVADATCGNGHDTLFLARLVGERGRVFAFDLQERAHAATRELLEHNGCFDRVEFIRAGHERLADFAPEGLAAVVFNLGYLPGADKRFVTRPETTLPALGAALSLLRPGGLLLVVVYTGHEGGAEEERAVIAWAGALDPRYYNVWSSRQLNRSPSAPYLVFVEKGGEGGVVARRDTATGRNG